LLVPEGGEFLNRFAWENLPRFRRGYTVIFAEILAQWKPEIGSEIQNLNQPRPALEAERSWVAWPSGHAKRQPCGRLRGSVPP
jgi:hypothetical protein